jgi:hypothetical protein
MKLTGSLLSCLSFIPWVATAGTVSLSNPLTDDASSLISTSNIYTHAISGGQAATVNGVDFADFSPGVTPANFSWVTSTGGQNEVLNNNGDWVPADGGVTGPGLQSLLGSFTYHGDGANPGSNQTFTLSGLTAGVIYDTRLYIRVWDTEASGRPIDFTLTNGAEIDTFGGLEDRPGTVLGAGNDHQAYFVNYRYTAQGTDLVINAAVPGTAPANSGSYHLYALSNQVVPEPGTAVSLLVAAGAFMLARRRR